MKSPSSYKDQFPKPDHSFYQNASPDKLTQIAAGYEYFMFDRDDPRGQPAKDYNWAFTEKLSLGDFLDSDDIWTENWKEEIEIWADEGEPDRFDDLMDGSPIREAVIVVMHEGRPHLWDGWHRVAAQKYIGKDTTPAIVGTLKQGK